ncbi:MAG: 3-deoxy-7-phosphoheptulonate synthase [Chitinophagales bacterium]|nr:3-deoxy-7-phosphoheptulonate synthase [Chitinophagales bacterium]
MIIHLNKNIDGKEAQQIADKLKAILIEKEEIVLVTPSKLQELPKYLEEKVSKYVAVPNDIQLASKKYISGTREISIGNIKIGGEYNHTLMITGPCSVENEEQIEKSAKFCVEQGVKVLRAGCYKPRTSPYSFQGLGLEGLKLLAKMRDKYGLKIITEVRDASHVDDVIEYADIVQIGAKAMYDHGILRRCGQARKPILLKRGFGSTLQEFVQAAEFILSGGNDDVILCERGIRTFETNTRFTLDLCGVAFLKEKTNLPIILDPSHAMGYAYGVPDLSRACVAMGIEGLLIETHPTPKEAWSDAAQQLNFDEFAQLQASLKPVANAVGRTLV